MSEIGDLHISHDDFSSVFPDAHRPSQTQSQEASWNIAVAWLKQYSILEKPSDEVQIALKNLLNSDGQLIDAHIEILRSHFYAHVAPKFEYVSNDESGDIIDETQTVKIIESIDQIRNHYYYPLHFIKMQRHRLETVDTALNALLHAVLVQNSGGNTLSFKFIENLKHLFSKYLYHEDQEKFFGLLKLTDKLLSVNMMKTVYFIIVYVTKYHLKNYIASNYSKKWHSKVLDDSAMFIRSTLLPRLVECYTFCEEASQIKEFSVDQETLYNDLLEMSKIELLKLRIDELFDIVNDYPHSTPTLEEIKHCLTTSRQRSFLVTNFTETVKRRLLHPGANTVDIISCYISMIRSFLIIDSKGVLLDKVCRPTRRYLKEKNDTIRYVVSGLLDNQNDNKLIELSDELKNAAEQKIAHNGGNATTTNTTTVVGDGDHKMHVEENLNWVPDPIDALPDFKRNKVGDIIESVISLFDSKNYFINEFLKHFSKQLINVEDYNIKSILNKLNLLKAKFENSTGFDSLDVMVRDIVESKKTDSAIHVSSSKNSAVDITNFHSTIVSYLFWPGELINPNKETKFKLPPMIHNQFTSYAAEYETAKKGRKIESLSLLGKVVVELELQDRTKEFEVSPDIASVIYLFNDNVSSLTLEQITNQLQMDNSLAKNALNYWTKNGILEESAPNQFKVLENEKSTDLPIGLEATHTSPVFEHNEEKESEKFKHMEIYFPFIQGMLTNLGSMNVTKIQGFLQMVVPKELNFSCTEAQLEDYLNFLADEDKLDLVGSKTYKLKA